MLKYILKRVLNAIPLIIIITVIVFTLIQLAPYDAVDSITTPSMSPSQIEAMKEAYGLDKPEAVQYFYWLKNVLQGDFGNSITSGNSISESLITRIPNTIALVLPAIIISIIIAVTLGLIAGYNKNKKLDKLIDTLCTLGISLPNFWFALILMIIFGGILRILPVSGMYTAGQEKNFLDYLWHLILPCTTLVIALTPEFTRYVRSSTITELSEDYVLVQKSYGATDFEIMFKHILKNVLVPIITILGTLLPMLVTGAFITETIFSWPGVGQYFLTAINALDYPVIMAILLLSSTLVIVGNLLADVLCSIVDPRIKEMQHEK